MVIDPVQSVKGRVVMDCFRSVHPNLLAMGAEPRISTANTYFLKPKPDRMSVLRGLGKLYYNMVINARSHDEHEVNMLQKMHESKRSWTAALTVDEDFHDLEKSTAE